MMKRQPRLLLPQSPDDFDRLIKLLMKKYKLSNEEHVAAVVANRIQHLPVDCAYTTLEHLGNCVLKNLAYQVAQNRSKFIQHKLQIDELHAFLIANPNDQQARDHLSKAVSEGSEYAKEIMETLEPEI